MAGFALPTVLIASVVMMMILTVSVSSVTAVRTALQTQYYEQLAKSAGEAGVAYAKACLAKNGNVPLWSDAKPLTPATDCAGNSLLSNNPFSALVVAGGGSGGGSTGGGGGGGGVIENDYFALGTGSYPITIGAGGAVPGNQKAGLNGGNSTFNSWTAVGGGGGGYSAGGSSGAGGQTGGSGGGGQIYYGSYGPGAGTAGQGNAGGSISGAGGGSTTGGGGAGGAGQNTTTANAGGNGGPGITSSVSGTSTYYGGGGGGGGTSGTCGSLGGTGGVGGGGGGATDGSGIGLPGSPNTGGGGGGGWCYASGNGGAGGSGVVMISYPNNGTVTATGGNQIYVSGPNKVHVFTSGGTFSVSAVTNSTCPTDPRCSVVVNNNLRSSFTVGMPTLDASGKAQTIPNNGYVQLLRESNGSVWRTYRQPSVQAAVVPDLCSGAATSTLGWSNAVATASQDTIPSAPSATSISMADSPLPAGAMYFRKDFVVTTAATYTVSVYSSSQDQAAIYVDGVYATTSQGALAQANTSLAPGCHTVTVKLTNETTFNSPARMTAAIQQPGSSPIITSDPTWRVDSGSVIDFSSVNYYADSTQWSQVQDDTNGTAQAYTSSWQNSGDAFSRLISPTGNGCSTACPPSSYAYLRDYKDFYVPANISANVAALCDDNCVVYIDGNAVLSGVPWNSITQQTISLTAGWHHAGVRLYNAGSAGNPSKAAVSVVGSDGTIFTRTDDNWLGTDSWTTSAATNPLSYDPTFVPSPNEIPAPARTFDALVVAAGGGGGANSAGGGGAGGLLPLFGLTASTGTYTVTVGTGGTGTTGSSTNGTKGGNSVFGSYTAAGGGYGASRDGGNAASSGGSGGGGAGASAAARTPGGAGTNNQGYAGGNGVTADAGVNATGGGGGGAGGAGVNGVSGGAAGNGGAGYITYMTGTRLGLAGGGGGAITVNGSTATSTDGGGNGNSMAALNGVANTGGGGGGRTGNAAGGNGGSGIVIVRFQTGTLTVSATGTYATSTMTDVNGVGYTVYTFTGNGTFTISAIN
ncbi:MAG TPA: hypothetical protein VN081_03770 [Dongiaceae bacterium]|nr:hypothetical protein [Dongiaceae bacterium]